MIYAICVTYNVEGFKVKANLGERAFVFAAATLWNALPRFIRETNKFSFKRQLKTYLFEKTFRTTYM